MARYSPRQHSISQVAFARIATLTGDTSKVASFGYEKGAARPGLTAPARRVAFFMEDTTAASWKIRDERCWMRRSGGRAEDEITAPAGFSLASHIAIGGKAAIK